MELKPVSNLIIRGLATKKNGKLMLSKRGRQVLISKTVSSPLLIKSPFPFAKTRRILFVCHGGIGMSVDAKTEFAKTVFANPIRANLIVNVAGARYWPKQELERIFKESDIIVAIGPFAKKKCKTILSGIAIKKKPRLLNFHISDSDYGRYGLVKLSQNASKLALDAVLESIEKK